MLTDIEWWGGLLLIWLSLCFYFLYKEYRHEPKRSVDFIATVVSFLTVGVLISLYFYRLDSTLLKSAYVTIVALAAVSTAIMLFWPEAAPTNSATEKNIKGKSESQGAKPAESGAQTAQNDAEEISQFEEILGQGILFFPNIVGVLMGVNKLMDLF